MELKICLNKNFCTPKDVALVIWENMKLAKELEFIYQTLKIGTEIIKPKEMNIEYISKVVCNYFNVPVEMLQSNTRKREIVQARQIAMFFSKSLTKSSLATIGSQIGDKDHATVLHACKTVNNLLDTDKRFRLQIVEIEGIIKSHKKLIITESTKNLEI
jgi:chromosomal replication initiation ATPase DnaA